MHGHRVRPVREGLHRRRPARSVTPKARRVTGHCCAAWRHPASPAVAGHAPHCRGSTAARIRAIRTARPRSPQEDPLRDGERGLAAACERRRMRFAYGDRCSIPGTLRSHMRLSIGGATFIAASTSTQADCRQLIHEVNTGHYVCSELHTWAASCASCIARAERITAVVVRYVGPSHL